MSPAGEASTSPRPIGAGFDGCAGGAGLVATGRSMIRPRPDLLTHLAERLPGRLPSTGGRVEPRLPAVSDPRLVLDEEPDHHVDPRMRARDRERLRQIARLLHERDAENPVRRIRLVAVLG